MPALPQATRKSRRAAAKAKASARIGIEKASQRKETIKSRHGEKLKRREELRTKIASADVARKQTLQKDIEDLDKEIEQEDQEMRDVEAEVEKYQQEVKKADEVMGDAIEETLEGENRPPVDVNKIAQLFWSGGKLPDIKGIDIAHRQALREYQRVLCFKKGFGDPAIVGDWEIPDRPIYRITADVTVPEGCPNLMDWRRADRLKSEGSQEKWSAQDISDVKGIAIRVPRDYVGRPEDLVTDEYLEVDVDGKPHAKRKPRWVEVQLLIEWKEGIRVKGLPDMVYQSWETRTGCRKLWKKAREADRHLTMVATTFESQYRRLGGMHSVDQRSTSPAADSGYGSPLHNSPMEEVYKTIKAAASLWRSKKNILPEASLTTEQGVEFMDEYNIENGQQDLEEDLETYEIKWRALNNVPLSITLSAAQGDELKESYDNMYTL